MSDLHIVAGEHIVNTVTGNIIAAGSTITAGSASATAK